MATDAKSLRSADYARSTFEKEAMVSAFMGIDLISATSEATFEGILIVANVFAKKGEATGKVCTTHVE